MLLIVSPNYRDEIVLLTKTASALGWYIYNGGWVIPPHLLKMRGAVYGERFFCEYVSEQMNWKLHSNPLDWLAKLPEGYVNRKITFSTLASARKITDKKFIKPADDKAFLSAVYNSGNDLPENKILDDTPVLISDVMNFTSKYRCFIKDRAVVAECCYYLKSYNMKEAEINKHSNYDNNSKAVIDFVNNMLKDQLVDCVRGTVIDVGRFKKDTYTVIGSNPVWTSDVYGCELTAVLDVIATACVGK